MCRAGEDLSLCYGLFRTLIFTLTTYSRQAAQGTGGTGALSSRHRCSLTRFLLTVNTLTTRVPHGSSRVLINHRHEPQDRLSSTAKVGYGIRSPKSHSTHSSGSDAAAAKLQSARLKAFGGPRYHLSIASRHRRCRRSAPQRLCAWPRRDWAGGEAQTSDGCGARNPFMGVFVDLCPGAGVGGPVLS